jgi:hypothetical protein
VGYPEDSGMGFTQGQNLIGGIVQQIPDARTLRGRRVRITGSYLLNVGTAGNDGISIWLKNKSSIPSFTGPDISGAGEWQLGGRQYDRFFCRTSVGGAIPGMSHVIEVTGNSSAYPYASTTVGTSVLNVRPPNLFIPAFDQLKNDTTDSYVDLTGMPSGTAGVVAPGDVRIWYLDNGFSGTPATDKSFRLYNEAATAVGVFQHFDAYVDIPDDADLFEDEECWIVVMATDPSDVGTMGSSASIEVHSLSVQVVVDDTNAEDRALYSILQERAYGTPWGGTSLSPRYLDRYPFYVPASSVGDVTAAQYISNDLLSFPAAGIGNPARYVFPKITQYGAAFAGDLLTLNLNVDELVGAGGPSELYAFVPVDIPQGAIVLSAQAVLQNAPGAVGSWNFIRVVQANASSETLLEDHMSTLVDLVSNGNFTTVSEVTEVAYRNRVGIWWPDNSARYGNGLTPGAAAFDAAVASASITGFFIYGTAGGDRYRAGQLVVRFAYDPRRTWGGAKI